MSSEQENWSDNVIQGVTNTVSLLNFMLRERGQLYATIIYLMEVLGKNQLPMPTLQSVIEYSKSFYVSFDQVDGEFVVAIHPREPGTEGDVQVDDSED
jgi:hypothetical protein